MLEVRRFSRWSYFGNRSLARKLLLSRIGVKSNLVVSRPEYGVLKLLKLIPTCLLSCSFFDFFHPLPGPTSCTFDDIVQRRTSNCSKNLKWPMQHWPFDIVDRSHRWILARERFISLRDHTVPGCRCSWFACKQSRSYPIFRNGCIASFTAMGACPIRSSMCNACLYNLIPCIMGPKEGTMI